MSKETFDVFGMTCAACQANVTKAVSRLEGVENADVSLIANTMKVDFDPQKTSVKAIEEAVDQIGYKAVMQKSVLNEEQPDSAAAQWKARQKRVLDEIAEKKTALIASVILLLVLMCFSMLPMLGIFTELMDMKWMMVSSIVQLVLCMVILFVQRSFFTHGFKALFHKAPNMDSLVAVGSAASFGYGLYGILRMAYGYGVMDHAIIHSSMDALYFEGAAMIVTLVSLGKFLEAKSKAKTGDALGKLVDLAPKTALIEKDGAVIEVAANQVVSGDLVIVRPGMRIPVDGIVQSGYGYVDQSAITGESIPVEKQPGDAVMSATMNVNGSFKFEATKVGADTTLSQIIRLVDEAGSSKAPIARLADKVAGVFVPVVMGVALATFIGWLLFGCGVSFALNCAISVLVISCPCALGLATPLAIMISTGKAAEYGILIKSAEALEVLHSINTVVLDKTGTITSGKPSLTSITLFDQQIGEDEMLSLAAAAEAGSEHPLGKAIVEAARARGLEIPEASMFSAVGGRGLKAVVNHTGILAGNRAFMKEKGIVITDKQEAAIEAAAANGQTPMIFALNDKPAAMLCVADTVRPTSREALKLLKEKGIKVVMLTGDNQTTAKAIASSLDVDEVIADVLPAEKESVIRDLQDQGRKVAMVGDGINDAPALARADVGIAIGAGTDIAVDSADVVLMKDNLLDVVTAIDLSRATIRNIKENLFWAFFYNCLGIPVAMGLFYPVFGWTLNPMIGAAAMSLSSVTVCLNALRLRFFKPKGMPKRDIEELKENKAEVQSAKAVLQHADVLEKAAMEKQTNHSLLIGIEGMSCSHCTSRVQEALEKADGIASAQASLDPGKALILYKNGYTRQEIEKAAFQAIEEAGYEPVSLIEADGKMVSENESLAGTESFDETNETAADGSSKRIILPVEGMSCSHCTSHVQEALLALPGVQSAKVTLDPAQAEIEALPDVTAEALQQAIRKAGYEPGDPKPEDKQKKIILPVEGMSCSHCTSHVQQALLSVPGVISADVTLNPGQAVIVSSPEVKNASLTAAVKEAGYEPKEPAEANDKTDLDETKPVQSETKSSNVIAFPWKSSEVKNSQKEILFDLNAAGSESEDGNKE